MTQGVTWFDAVAFAAWRADRSVPLYDYTCVLSDN
jgi:hypothetical protein